MESQIERMRHQLSPSFTSFTPIISLFTGAHSDFGKLHYICSAQLSLLNLGERVIPSIVIKIARKSSDSLPCAERAMGIANAKVGPDSRHS